MEFLKSHRYKELRMILNSTLIKYCINGDEYKALALLECCYLDELFRVKNGDLILIFALKNNMITLANKLLQSNDIDINEYDHYSMTALLIACYNQQESIALSILEFPFGNTALIIACQYNLEKVVSKLLDFDDLNYNYANGGGVSALIIACANDMESVVFKLLEKKILISIKETF